MIHSDRVPRGREKTMASYQKILLCYDGSREGRKALRCGADLALDLKAETHLLSVVDMRSSIAQSAGLLTDVACGSFEKTARDILQEGVDWLTERGVNRARAFRVRPSDRRDRQSRERIARRSGGGRPSLPHRVVAMVDGRGQYAAARSGVVQHSGGVLFRAGAAASGAWPDAGQGRCGWTARLNAARLSEPQWLGRPHASRRGCFGRDRCICRGDTRASR